MGCRGNWSKVVDRKEGIKLRGKLGGGIQCVGIIDGGVVVMDGGRGGQTRLAGILAGVLF